MVLNFFNQQDIDEIDINDIPEEFINYYESLDDTDKDSLLASRPELANALREVFPDTYIISGKELKNDINSKGEIILKKLDEQKEINETDRALSGEYDVISQNMYEGRNLREIVVNNMKPLEALAISDSTTSCILHHIPFEKKTIKYTISATYGITLFICNECNRIFIRESSMEHIHNALVKRNIPHTFYDLDLTNRYLYSQMKDYEFEKDEKLYIPETWAEDRPVCPIHNSELIRIPCTKKYKERKITFTGYLCEQCNKILIRKAHAIDLNDECAILGIPTIESEALIKQKTKMNLTLKEEIKPDFIIEDRSIIPYQYDYIVDNYMLSEEDIIVVSDSACCSINGHESEEVLVSLWIQEKKGAHRVYMLCVGYCNQCQKYYMDIDDYELVYKIGRPEVTLIIDYEDKEYLITSGEVFNLERTHLNDLETNILSAIKKIEHSSDYVSVYATGDYDDGGLSFAKSLSKKKYGKRLENLKSYISSPYVYRVDIEAEDKTEVYYIGADDIILDERIQVISANSDFGRELVNYRNIKVKKGEKEYVIKLTRHFEIDHAVLYGYENLRTDEDLIFKNGVVDPFLKRILKMRKKQHQLTDIFITIQENQNQIINNDFNQNIIVQGCAGSGKTMILLHRLSALKYREKFFDFEKYAMILTPNDQFSLHIKGLAESLQIGTIVRSSIEQYYVDMLMQYDLAFKPDTKISEEMFVRQDYVDYIYSDQFRREFDKAYVRVITERNNLVEKFNVLIENIGQFKQINIFDDDYLVTLQIKLSLETIYSSFKQKEQNIIEAKEMLDKMVLRYHFLELRLKEREVLANNIVQEKLSSVYLKINIYITEKQNRIVELKEKKRKLRSEYLKIERSFIIFGKHTRLVELESQIKDIDHMLRNFTKQLEVEEIIFKEAQGNKSDEEIIKWMKKVAFYIKDVDEDIRICNMTRQEIVTIREELQEKDGELLKAQEKINQAQKVNYDLELKQEFEELSNKMNEYTMLNTYHLIFNEATASFKEEYGIKNINGKYHRYDLYAQLLFAKRYYHAVYGQTKFMCIDEGQELAFNEYRLIYELNQNNLIFNIFGDTNQLMKPGRGISDWSVIEKEFAAKKFTLNENYRNTNQITRFCNNSFDMNVLMTGVDGPSVREIPRRDLEKELATLDISIERVAILVPRGVQKKKYLYLEQLPPNMRDIIGDTIEDGRIAFMYVDEVKGIEFNKVYVIENKMARNEKYIAYTRALWELIIVVDENIADFDDGSDKKSQSKKYENRKKNTARLSKSTLKWNENTEN